MELNYEDIGKRIRAERLRQNVQQDRLADMAKLSVTHTSHVETGNTKLSLPTLVKIANALCISADELLCDSLVRAKDVFENEITKEVKDCSEQEIRIIAETIKTLKAALRKSL